jgi:hypothetical protein
MAKKKKEIISNQRTGYGALNISQTVRHITKKIVGKKGFVEVDIISKWETIVGKELAENVIPQKIIFKKGRRDGGTLYVLVSNGAFALELQHKEQVVISRINSFFGYRAIEKINISQGYWEVKKQEKKENKIDKIEKNEKVEKTVSSIENQELKDTLEKLGNLVYMKKKPIEEE